MSIQLPWLTPLFNLPLALPKFSPTPGWKQGPARVAYVFRRLKACCLFRHSNKGTRFWALQLTGSRATFLGQSQTLTGLTPVGAGAGGRGCYGSRRLSEVLRLWGRRRRTHQSPTRTWSPGSCLPLSLARSSCSRESPHVPRQPLHSTVRKFSLAALKSSFCLHLRPRLTVRTQRPRPQGQRGPAASQQQVPLLPSLPARPEPALDSHIPLRKVVLSSAHR